MIGIMTMVLRIATMEKLFDLQFANLYIFIYLFISLIGFRHLNGRAVYGEQRA